MITELTEKQEEMIKVYRDKGLRIGLETQPEGLAGQEEEIRGLIRRLYQSHKLSEPVVFFAQSPRSGQHLVNMIDMLPRDTNLLSLQDDNIKVESLAQKEAAKNNIDFNKSLKKYSGSYLTGSQELYWLYFYQYINNELPVEKTNLPLQETIDLCEKVGWFWTFDNYVVVTPKPSKLVMANDRLSCSTGAAIEYLDGFKVYAINGVRFSTEQGERYINGNPLNKDMVKDILNIKNAEQRAELIKLYGVEKFFTNLNPVLLDKKQDYELYSVPVYEDMPRIYLKMVNPSVNEIHLEADHPECQTVEQALNWRRVGEVEIPKYGFVPPVTLT